MRELERVKGIEAVIDDHLRYFFSWLICNSASCRSTSCAGAMKPAARRD
jgi:hypothetical protein